MILAAAQTKPKQGDIDSNLMNHYCLIKIAAQNGAHLITFPELSITGYEREKAKELSFSKDDVRLNKLKELAVENTIIIIAGAPIQIESELFIGQFIIYPDNSISIYTKQFLHEGEDEFFQSSFDYNPIVVLNNQKISFAICADIDNPLHPEYASKKETSIYIANIFFSPNGIPNAYDQLQNYAQKHKMNVLMSNFNGESYKYPAGGKSAFWNNKGELIAQMTDSDSGILLLENKNDNWSSQIIIN